MVKSGEHSGALMTAGIDARSMSNFKCRLVMEKCHKNRRRRHAVPG